MHYAHTLDSNKLIWNALNCWIQESKLPKASVWHTVVGKDVHCKEEKQVCYTVESGKQTGIMLAEIDICKHFCSR